MEDYTILAAIDFSKGSTASLLWAIDFADRTNGNLKIVHVIHDPASKPGTYKRDKQDILMPMQEIAQEQYDMFMADILAQRPDSHALKGAELLMVNGLPAKRIVSLAKKIGASHIVLGCMGQGRGTKGKIPKMFVGSVALRVLKKAPISVTIIKIREQQKKSKDKKSKKSKD